MSTARLLTIMSLALPLAAQLVAQAGPAGTAQVRRREPITVTAGQQKPCASAPEVVDDIYKQVLERPADQASAGMTQALAAGRMTVRDIVAQVAKSPEHAARFYWQPVVAAVYRQVMKRDPHPQELHDTAADLAAGRVQLPEVVARVATRAANNQEDAVRILYRRLLGREPDPEGLRTFTDLARRDGIEAVARQIVASPEYRQRGGAIAGSADVAAHEAGVRTLYRHLLGRDPDPEGLRNLTQVAMTSSFNAVVDRIVSSPEYMKQFGNDVVPGIGTRFCGSPQPRML